MNNEYYWGNLRKLAGLKDKAIRARSSWFRHMALVASAVFGIQVALRQDNSNTFQILASSLLILCILCSATASWFEVYSRDRGAKYFHQELQQALRENRKIGTAYVHKPKIFSVAEVVAILAFVSSCGLLSIGC